MYPLAELPFQRLARLAAAAPEESVQHRRQTAACQRRLMPAVTDHPRVPALVSRRVAFLPVRFKDARNRPNHRPPYIRREIGRDWLRHLNFQKQHLTETMAALILHLPVTAITPLMRRRGQINRYVSS